MADYDVSTHSRYINCMYAIALQGLSNEKAGLLKQKTELRMATHGNSNFMR